MNSTIRISIGREIHMCQAGIPLGGGEHLRTFDLDDIDVKRSAGD